MKVFINNEENSVAENSTVDGILEQLNIDAAKGVAIAINDKVITKSDWCAYSIEKNDKITIIKATQGG